MNKSTRKIPRQVGSSNVEFDKRIKAKLPGYRISASGTKYYENRKNRSDTPSERKTFDSKKVAMVEKSSVKVVSAPKKLDTPKSGLSKYTQKERGGEYTREDRDKLYKNHPDEWWDRLESNGWDNTQLGIYTTDDEEKYLFKQHQKSLRKQLKSQIPITKNVTAIKPIPLVKVNKTSTVKKIKEPINKVTNKHKSEVSVKKVKDTDYYNKLYADNLKNNVVAQLTKGGFTIAVFNEKNGTTKTHYLAAVKNGIKMFFITKSGSFTDDFDEAVFFSDHTNAFKFMWKLGDVYGWKPKHELLKRANPYTRKDKKRIF